MFTLAHNITVMVYRYDSEQDIFQSWTLVAKIGKFNVFS